jgi:hypothetical protein
MTFEGDLDGRQIRAAYDEAFKDPAFQRGCQILVDDHGTTFDPTMEEAQRLADFFCTLTEAVSHLAVVVDKDVHYGIGRMVEVYCESCGINLRIFRDLDEAKAWLDQARG